MALANKKHTRIYSTTGSDSDKIDSTKLDRIAAKFNAKEHIVDEDSFETLGPVLYQLQQVTEELDEIRRFAAAELNHKATTRHVLNCGFVGSYSSRQFMPFAYGGTFEYTSTAGRLEYFGFVAPCNGKVDHVVMRSENMCGNSQVNIHIAGVGLEVPSNTPNFFSTAVNMAADDTSYKFQNFTNQGGQENAFTAGQIIMISFDPTYVSGDTVSTAVLELDWTNEL